MFRGSEPCKLSILLLSSIRQLLHVYNVTVNEIAVVVFERKRFCNDK